MKSISIFLFLLITLASNAQDNKTSGLNARQFHKYWKVESESPDYKVTFRGDTAEILSQLLGYNITPILMGMDTTIRLPILGYAKAGYDLFAEENYLGEEETTLKERENGDYYLRITGNSMSGIGIMDGSLVLVRQCDSIASGKIAVVMIDQEVTVKRVIYKKGMMILEAANPDVESRYFTPQEIKELPVKIIGQVLSCRTSF